MAAFSRLCFEILRFPCFLPSYRNARIDGRSFSALSGLRCPYGHGNFRRSNIDWGVFPVDLGTKFDPSVPPGITVPEWYLTGLYAFLRTMYDKFVTGVAWPGLFIFALLIVPFIDRYKNSNGRTDP